MSVLTEHVNSSSALAEFPLRADRARQMGELAPVLATPAVVVVAAYNTGVIVCGGGGGGFTPPKNR